MATNTVTPVKQEETSPVDNGPQEASASSLLTFPPNNSKRNKKDDRSVAALMKALNEYPTVEERLAMMCQKHVMAVDEIKKLHFYMKQSDKRHAIITKEKLHQQSEYNKLLLVKDRLENLCRELQKQNKLIKEESHQRINEMKQVRKETHNKFQTTLSEINVMLQADNEKNARLHNENINMNDKFKSILEEYKLREQQVEKLGQQMSLEQQLAEAKLQKASLEHQADKERLLAEMEHIKMELAQYKAKIVELTCTESSLRSQLTVYTDKYDEFQNTLVKSNQVFGGFKGEIEKMSKKIISLEKESLSWKRRWEESQVSLINNWADKHMAELKLLKTHKQLDQLQKLCRTLQAERTLLYMTLKEHQIERPPIPVIQNTTESQSALDDQMEAMAVKWAQMTNNIPPHILKLTNLTLTNLNSQTDMETPSMEQNDNNAETGKAETGKAKKKSKKNKSKGDKPKDGTEDSEEIDVKNIIDIIDKSKGITDNNNLNGKEQKTARIQVDEETIKVGKEKKCTKVDVKIEAAHKEEVKSLDTEEDKELDSVGTAVKEDVNTVDTGIKEEMKSMDTEIKEEVKSVEPVKGEKKSVDTGVEEKVKSVDTGVKEEVKSLDTGVKEEVKSIDTEVKEKVKSVDTEAKGDIKSVDTGDEEKVKSVVTNIKEEVKSIDTEVKEVVKSAYTEAKEELKCLDTEVKEEVKYVDTEPKVELKSLDAKVKEEIKSVDTEPKEELKSLDAKVKEEVKSVDTEAKEDLKSLDVKVKEEVKSVDTEAKEELKCLDTVPVKESCNIVLQDSVKRVPQESHIGIEAHVVSVKIKINKVVKKVQDAVKDSGTDSTVDSIDKSNTVQELKAEDGCKGTKSDNTETKAHLKGKKRNKKGKDPKCANADPKTKLVDTSNDEITETLEVKSILDDSVTT